MEKFFLKSFINSNIKLFTICLITFIYLCLVLKFYEGNRHSIYLHMWPYALGLGDFKYDIFVQSSHMLKLSIIFNLFSFFKINLDNDIIGLLVHLISTTLSAFYTFKIVNEKFEIKNIYSSLIIIFSIVFISGIFITANKSTWITNHTASTTYFAHILIPCFIWLLLNNKFFILFLLSSLMLLIAVKAAWFTVAVGAVFSIYKNKLKNNYWIAGPILVFIYIMSLNLGDIHTEENRILFFDALILRDEEEIAFHLQSKLKLFLLIFSFPISYYLISKTKNKDLKDFLKTVLFLSISCFIFFYIYALYGKSIYPDARILGLSGTRALGLYEFLFWLSLFSFIYHLDINYLYKILISAFIFHATTVDTFAIISISILITLILVINFLFKDFFKNIIKLNLLFFLLILPGTLALTNSHIKNTFDLYGFKKINKWTTGKLLFDKPRLVNAIKLKKCEDFLILDLKHNNMTSAISGKSNYIGNYHFNYFDKSLIIESNRRGAIARKAIKYMHEKQNFTNSIIEEFYKFNLILIINKKYLEQFPDDIIKYDLKNGDYLLIFLKEANKFKKFENTCLKKISI